VHPGIFYYRKKIIEYTGWLTFTGKLHQNRISQSQSRYE